jgi:hypothetical protein
MTKMTIERLRPILVMLASGLIVLAWSLASPVGSAPDEPSQGARAYGLMSGQQGFFPETDGLAPPLPEGFLGQGSGAVAPYVDTRLPKYFVEKPRAGCYAFRPDLSAVECWPKYRSELVTVKGFQSYFVPGYAIFAGSIMRASEITRVADPWGLTVTRAVSAVFNGLIFGLGIVLAFPRNRVRFAALVALILLVPLTSFTLGSLSPSSWEISGMTLLVGAVIAISRVAPSALREPHTKK